LRVDEQAYLVERASKNGARLVKNALEYQRKAEECRQRAECAVHPDDKTGWLRAAEDWQKLARCAERSAQQRGLAAALSVVHGPGAEVGDVDH
jgi:hypothetical protein